MSYLYSKMNRINSKLLHLLSIRYLIKSSCFNNFNTVYSTPKILIFIGFVFILCGCRSKKTDERTSLINKGSLLTYEIEQAGSSYILKMKLNYVGDSCGFQFSTTQTDRTEGTVHLGREAVSSAIILDPYLSTGHTFMQYKTVMMLSKKGYSELKSVGRTKIIPSYRDTVELILDSSSFLELNFSDQSTEVPVLNCSGNSRTGKIEMQILDQSEHPFITFMSNGVHVKLKSIRRMSAVQMQMKAALFEWKPGLKLYYYLEEFGCGRDVIFELLEKNEKNWTFKYEYYVYACLFGQDDMHFAGILNIPDSVMRNPQNFVIPNPEEFGENFTLQQGNPFLLGGTSFSNLFALGSAELPMQHFVYEPSKEEMTYFDSAERVQIMYDLTLANKTRFLMKEADVETGYYMYPILINDQESVLESVKLEASAQSHKFLYVYPTREYPLILSHTDEEFGFKWHLSAIWTEGTK